MRDYAVVLLLGVKLCVGQTGADHSESATRSIPAQVVPFPEAGEVFTHDQVGCGIDVLRTNDFALLRGSRVGLITNHTGLARDGASTIDLVNLAEEVELIALFGPEHGIRGEADEEVAHGIDGKTGLPVFSLYGESKKPDEGQLVGIDTLVFDIQDIGCRFYTYIATMKLAMGVAADHGLRFVVLDRPNPIGGLRVEGAMLDGATSFTAPHALPIRHGMTVGELAVLFQKETPLEKLELEVVPCAGWRRGDWHDETGLPWVRPSPNMPDLEAAALYPGVGLLEFMNLSVGRGTDAPFRVVGAPYLDGEAMATALRAYNLRGLEILPEVFTPTKSAFVGERCQGVRLVVNERSEVDPLRCGLAIATYLAEHHADTSDIGKFGKLLVHPSTLQAVQDGDDLLGIVDDWQDALTAFERRRSDCLIYPE